MNGRIEWDVIGYRLFKGWRIDNEQMIQISHGPKGITFSIHAMRSSVPYMAIAVEDLTPQDCQRLAFVLQQFAEEQIRKDSHAVPSNEQNES